MTYNVLMGTVSDL